VLSRDELLDNLMLYCRPGVATSPHSSNQNSSPAKSARSSASSGEPGPRHDVVRSIALRRHAGEVSSSGADAVRAALVVPYLRGVVVRGTLAIMGERLQVLLGLL
jgi:hypothetical protein